MISASIDKTSLLNDVLAQSFNSGVDPLLTFNISLFAPDASDLLDTDTLCTTKELIRYLKGINIGKASGPDGISSHYAQRYSRVDYSCSKTPIYSTPP